MDINLLVTAREAATLKGFKSVDAMIYHVKNKPGSPQPKRYHGIRFFVKAEILAWEPNHKPGPVKESN